MEFQGSEVLGVSGLVFHLDTPSKPPNCQVAMDSHTAPGSCLTGMVLVALVGEQALVEKQDTPLEPALALRLRP